MLIEKGQPDATAADAKGPDAHQVDAAVPFDSSIDDGSVADGQASDGPFIDDTAPVPDAAVPDNATFDQGLPDGDSDPLDGSPDRVSVSVDAPLFEDWDQVDGSMDRYQHPPPDSAGHDLVDWDPAWIDGSLPSGDAAVFDGWSNQGRTPGTEPADASDYRTDGRWVEPILHNGRDASGLDNRPADSRLDRSNHDHWVHNGRE